MKLDIKELLDFYDDKKDSKKGDANALMAMFGEDLNASSYKHFRDNKVDILEDPVVQGFKGGKQLDRWILDDENNKLFQCEIKNWAATAIGGKQLKSDASEEEIKEIVEYHRDNLHRVLSNKVKHPSGVSKVFLKMKTPERYKMLKVEPLLIFWMPISFDKLESSSNVSISSLGLPTEFSKLYIFSVSLYLRQLYKNGIGFIDLGMPHLDHRIKILSKLQIIK
jgi:hypothetical protein